MTAIGIDFGTTNSVAAAWRTNGPEVLAVDDAPADWVALGFDRVMPSVFATAPDGTTSFGWEAKRAESGRFEAVKRLFATKQDLIADDLGLNALAVEEAATLLFAQLRRAVVGHGIDARKAVITVPANSRGLARHRTKICAGMAGFEVLALLNEPTAAAMAYAAQNPGDQQIMVFDWGGGTLDVTVLRTTDGIFMEQASKGLPAKGGLDFDLRLRKLILESAPDYKSWTPSQRHDFELDVEKAKIQLSSTDSTVILLPGDETRRITRRMLDEAVGTLIEESRRPIQQCLDDLHIGPGSIDAVVMVGGTSAVPAVRAFVSEIMKQESVRGIDPMTAVGEGAAIAAAIMSGQFESSMFFVSTEHALGVIAHERDDRPFFSTLIPRNMQLPASHSETYHPVHPDQEDVRIRVIEGDPAQDLDHPENVILKEWDVPLPGPPGTMDRSFDITFEYDLDGILHVTVVDDRTSTTMLTDDVSYGVTSDKPGLVRMSKRAAAVVGGEANLDFTDRADLDAEAAQLLQRAHVKVIPFLDEGDAASIRTLATALESASRDELPAAKDALRDALTPFSYLF